VTHGNQASALRFQALGLLANDRAHGARDDRLKYISVLSARIKRPFVTRVSNGVYFDLPLIITLIAFLCVGSSLVIKI
jgi:hypothetical protein